MNGYWSAAAVKRKQNSASLSYKLEIKCLHLIGSICKCCLHEYTFTCQYLLHNLLYWLVIDDWYHQIKHKNIYNSNHSIQYHPYSLSNQALILASNPKVWCISMVGRHTKNWRMRCHFLVDWEDRSLYKIPLYLLRDTSARDQRKRSNLYKVMCK